MSLVSRLLRDGLLVAGGAGLLILLAGNIAKSPTARNVGLVLSAAPLLMLIISVMGLMVPLQRKCLHGLSRRRLMLRLWPLWTSIIMVTCWAVSVEKYWLTCDDGNYAECSARCNGMDARSCTELARIYDDGDGIPRDPALAFKALEKGCSWGGKWECSAMAARIKSGDGVPKDEARALKLREGYCAEGDAYSCWSVAESVLKDNRAEATRLLRKACSGGVRSACTKLRTLGETQRQ
jgi:TPR repeat protein